MEARYFMQYDEKGRITARWMTFVQDGAEFTPPDGYKEVAQNEFDSAAPVTTLRVITSRAFIRRFTDAEVGAFETLAVKDSPEGAQARAAKMILGSAPTVDLDHPDTLKYLAFLKSVGILTDKRIAVIREDEKPAGVAVK